MGLLAGCALPSKRAASGGDEDPARTLYEAGRTALLAQDYDQAIGQFQRLLILHPDHALIPQARMELAYSYYKSGDTLSAMAAAERFIRDYPRHPSVDYLYYLRGLAAYEQSIAFLNQQAEGETSAMPPLIQLAVQYFEVLIERFPTSKYGEDARTRLAHLQDALARLEIHQAKRALARGDYATAALHARAVTEKYPQSGHSREAEALLVMAGRALEQEPQSKARLITPGGETGAPSETAASSTGTAQDPAMQAARNAGDIPAREARQAAPDTPGSDSDPLAAAEDFGRRGAAWLSRQPPHLYTLQLLATANRDALLAFVSRHKLHAQAAYLSERRNDRPWYTLLYGLYPDRRAAVKAAAALPRAVRELKPWPRRVGVLQARLKQAATP